MAIGQLRRVADLHHLTMTALGVGDAAAVGEHVDWLRSMGRSHNTMHDRVRLLIRLYGWLQSQESPKTLLTAECDDLAAWQRSMSGLAVQSIATYVGHAKGFYKWRAKFQHAPDITGLLERPTVPKGLPRPISDQELQTLLRITDGQMLTCLLLMAFCGLRVGEVSRLQRVDIHDADSPPIVIVHGKGHKYRIVRMPNDLGGYLQLAGLPLRGNVVLSAKGRPVSPNRLCQIVNGYLHSQGVADTAHTLRHWYGTNVYRLTRDLRLVQEMLGHSSPTTTAVYAAYAPEQADDMATKLDAKIAAMLQGMGGRRLRAVD